MVVPGFLRAILNMLIKRNDFCYKPLFVLPIVIRLGFSLLFHTKNSIIKLTLWLNNSSLLDYWQCYRLKNQKNLSLIENKRWFIFRKHYLGYDGEGL